MCLHQATAKTPDQFSQPQRLQFAVYRAGPAHARQAILRVRAAGRSSLDATLETSDQKSLGHLGIGLGGQKQASC